MDHARMKELDDQFELNLNEVDNLVFGGIEPKDHPDYANLFVENADYYGKEMDYDELNELNDKHSEWIHEQFINSQL